MVNSAGKMPLATCRQILEKAKSQGAESISFFNWTEPFLVPDLHEYVSIVKELGMRCRLSTNLSFREIPHLGRVLASGVDHLIISVSGLDQEIYEMNHRGGNIGWIKNNLEILSRLKKSGAFKTTVVLRFIKFDYNEDQEEKARAYAAELGLGFEGIAGAGHPFKRKPKSPGDESPSARLEFAGRGPHPEKDGEVCPMLFSHVPLNHDGDVYLCCTKKNNSSTRIGAFLELSPEEVLFRRYTHPVCGACDWKRRASTPAEQEKLKRAEEAVHVQTRGGVTPK